MADMQIGGWYNNPAAGGANQRYWGGSTWTTGADPTASGGSSNSGTQSYGDIYKNAASLVTPVDTSALEGVAGDIQTDSKANYQNILDQIPLTRNVYTDLANQLDQTYQKQSSAVNAQGVADVGQQTDTAAQSGFATTGGYEASMLRAVKTSYNNQITDLLNQYGLQRTSIADDEAKSVGELTQQASEALLSGDTARASVLTSIAQIKQGNQAAIATVAGQSADFADAQAKNKIAQQGADAATENANTAQLSAQNTASGGSGDASSSVLSALATKLLQQSNGGTTTQTPSIDKYVYDDGSGGTSDLSSLLGFKNALNTAPTIQQSAQAAKADAAAQAAKVNAAYTARLTNPLGSAIGH